MLIKPFREYYNVVDIGLGVIVIWPKDVVYLSLYILDEVNITYQGYLESLLSSITNDSKLLLVFQLNSLLEEEGNAIRRSNIIYAEQSTQYSLLIQDRVGVLIVQAIKASNVNYYLQFIISLYYKYQQPKTTIGARLSDFTIVVQLI